MYDCPTFNEWVIIKFFKNLSHEKKESVDGNS